MTEVKWIKIVTDVFDDEKILLIESLPEADSIIVIWFKLLCLAGKQNNSGVFVMNGRIAYTNKMLATIFRRKEATVKLALETFESFGMIEIVDNVITIPNWEKHQQLNQLEIVKEQTRKRVAKYRERQKNLAIGNGKEECNVTVTKSNADRIDKIRLDKEKDNNTVVAVAGDSCGDGLQLVDSCDDELRKVIDFYENNIGAITPYSLEIFTDYLKELSSEVIIYAMKKAVEADKRAINYIKGTLNNWINSGIKTLIDAERESENFKNRKLATKGGNQNGEITNDTGQYKGIDLSTNRAKWNGKEIDDTGLI